MSKKLETIRRKIDAHDDSIHDVLMQRAALIDDVIAEKKKHGLQFVHPAREAQMIRRLIARHKGELPVAAIVRIWRELVGAVSLLQTGLKVVVCIPDESRNDLWEHARNYFGSVIAMQKYTSPLLAIAAVREGEASFAVLPWPVDEIDENTDAIKPSHELMRWWISMIEKEKDIRIVCALPYGVVSDGQGRRLPSRGLVVSRIEFSPSGDDVSFIALDIAKDVSRARIISGCEAQGLTVHGLVSQPVSYHEGEKYMHVIEVGGYVPDDDMRLAGLSRFFAEDESAPVKAVAMGGYPVPPVFEKNNKTTVTEE